MTLIHLKLANCSKYLHRADVGYFESFKDAYQFGEGSIMRLCKLMCALAGVRSSDDHWLGQPRVPSTCPIPFVFRSSALLCTLSTTPTTLAVEGRTEDDLDLFSKTWISKLRLNLKEENYWGNGRTTFKREEYCSFSFTIISTYCIFHAIRCKLFLHPIF